MNTLKIRISADNLSALNAAISAAEGRATARTISASDVLDTVEEIEKTLDVPKKALIGVSFDADLNAQHFPSAYKYTPESTHFTAMRFPSGWFLTSVERWICRAPSNRILITHTNASREALIKRFTALA